MLTHAIKGMNSIYISTWMDLKNEAQIKNKSNYRKLRNHLDNILNM